jgi:hypothetical protein
LGVHPNPPAHASCNCKVFASGRNPGFRKLDVLEFETFEFIRYRVSRRTPPGAQRARRNNMEPTSRRQFLKRSSAVAAAAGVAAAVPATAAKALTASGSAEKEPRLPEDASVDVPVVAHVRDVRKGLVSLYTGEREITIKNRRLAAALYHASR